MKPEDLKDRKRFLLMQESIVADRLNKFIKDSKPEIHKAISVYESFKTTSLDLEPYVIYRCENFIEYCSDYIVSILNNLVLSSTKIEKESFNSLFKVKYIFTVFKDRIPAQGYPINVLVNINTGEIAFNKENLKKDAYSLSAIENVVKNETNKKDVYSLSAIEDVVKNENLKKIIKNKKDFYIPEHMHTPVNTPKDSPFNLSFYKHHFSSFEFLNMNFYTERVANLEQIFKRPFSIHISINEMNNWVAYEKTKAILKKLNDIKGMDIKDMQYLSSYEYCRIYGYDELLSLNGIEDNKISEEVYKFFEDVSENKQNLVLNFLLNIAPGLIPILDFKRFKSLPNSYLIEWVDKYIDSNE